jgi:hypothetical protein
MIIIIKPENEFEKQKFKRTEHKGVKEFHIFGNKKEDGRDLQDFHEWTGSYRYLEGSLHYFLNTIADDRRAKAELNRNDREISLTPPQARPNFYKTGVVSPEIQMLDNVAKDIDVENNLPNTIEIKDNGAIQFPNQSPVDNPVDNPEEE